MAKYSAQAATWTPIAVADTTNYTNAGYMALQGVASTRVVIQELYMGGQAGASSPTIMVFARDTVVGVTSLTGVTTALIDAAAQASTALSAGFNSSTTKPQRSSTLYLLNLSFNAFGGIVRWVAAPGEEPTMFGATASLGEVSLSAFTGGTPGLMGSHMVYDQARAQHNDGILSVRLSTHLHHRANRGKTLHAERLAPYISGAI